MPGLDPLAVGAVACVALAAFTIIAIVVLQSLRRTRREDTAGGAAEGFVAWGTFLTGVLLTAAIILGIACVVAQWLAGPQ